MTYFEPDMYGWNIPMFFCQLGIVLLWTIAIIWLRKSSKARKIYVFLLLLFSLFFAIIAWSEKPVGMVHAQLHILPYLDAPSTVINEQVELLGEKDGWCYVKAKHQFGWIKKDHIN